MRNTFFYSLLFIFSFLIISCGEEDPTCMDGIQNGLETGVDCGGPDCPACETTVDEDKANIQETFDQFEMCSSIWKNSISIDILFNQFLGLTAGEVTNENWIEDITGTLDDVIDVDHIDMNDRLDFAYHSGTHIYDHSLGAWTKVNDVDNRMVFLFPSEPTLTTNNVELVMDEYVDQQVTIDGDNLYLPTALHITMHVDGALVMEVDVDKVTYADNADFEIPVEIDATIYTDPLTTTIKLQRLSTTEYDLFVLFDDVDNCTFSLEAQVDLKDDDFENLSNDDFEKVHVRVNLGRLSIQSLADIATLIAISDDEDVSEAQLNTLLDIDALFDGVKIADLEISEEQETVIIFYKDLSSEDSKVYYQSFWEDVKNTWEGFFQ